MQVNFDPHDTTGLSQLFRRKPVEGGLLAVFTGGRRPDRFFAAYLMAGELGLPLVQAAIAVPGCLSFVDLRPVLPGVGLGAALAGSAVLGLQFSGVSGTSQTRPLSGSALVLSLDDPAPDLEKSADFVIRFSAAGQPAVVPPPARPRVAADSRADACCNFDVAIDGQSYGFSEVSALACVAHGSRGTVYPNIVLRRAIPLNKDLYEWRMNIAGGQADVRTMTISHLSAAFEATRIWWIEGAWPVRWTGPSFGSMATCPAMEEIEICVSRFEWR